MMSRVGVGMNMFRCAVAAFVFVSEEKEGESEWVRKWKMTIK
jgi:hypothetical protein